ncbi:hypothetical protein [Dyadobacter tibetensis]|uniref:hypothetical protein n=1 Tax=Dyadobacter tibetensis TaxID=1211851 RepID=UPI0004BAFA48|nr:hypothetical protein [Dyadobacter tibetensis]
MNPKLTSLSLILLFYACTTQNSRLDQDEARNEVNTPEQKVVHYYKHTKKGRKIHVKELQIEGMPLVEIQIIPSGYPNNHPVEIGAVDPIDHIELADLDRNGEDELYIFTRETGIEKKGNFYVFAPLKGEKFVQIEMEFLDPKEFLKGGKLEGYLGHDQFVLEKDRVIRTYPIFEFNDTIVKATDAHRKVIYKIKNHQIKMMDSYR